MLQYLNSKQFMTFVGQISIYSGDYLVKSNKQVKNDTHSFTFGRYYCEHRFEEQSPVDNQSLQFCWVENSILQLSCCVVYNEFLLNMLICFDII